LTPHQPRISESAADFQPLELHPYATHLCGEKHRKGAAARIAVEYRDAAEIVF
jgi:hypothetical protein